MHSIRLQMTRNPLKYFRLIINIQKKHKLLHSACYCATRDDVDSFTTELLEKFKTKHMYGDLNSFSMRHFADGGSNVKDITNMTAEEVDDLISFLISKNKDSQLEQVILECLELKKFIGEPNLRKLFRHYSRIGKPEKIPILQSYCNKLDNFLYRKNGEYTHYIAKAQCYRGNSDKGLLILKQCYEKNENLRSLYRNVFRELIQDSVMNRSEASLVTFRKYVLEFSEMWKDHYPLVCFWHICWSSSWFSDQMLADELLETSESLREVIQDRALAFSITILREEYNEDAVVRLLQTLLKYDMMDAYVKVLQVLFNYKLRNRDIRGCSEIIKNCEVLGVSLPSVSQGRYITMIIHENPQADSKPTAKKSKDFKLKF